MKFFLLLLLPLIARAEGPNLNIGNPLNPNKPTAFLDLPSILGRTIGTLISYMAVAAFVMVLYAGFLYLTAGGSAEKTSKAKEILKWTVIGVVIVLGSYVIMYAVFELLGKAPGVGPS